MPPEDDAAPVAPAPAEACADMAAVRDQIDRVDAALVDLLAERWTYVDRAWRLKGRPGDAQVRWRNEQVIEKVRAKAEATGVPPELAEALWRLVIGWGIQYQQERLRPGSDGDGDGEA